MTKKGIVEIILLVGDVSPSLAGPAAKQLSLYPNIINSVTAGVCGCNTESMILKLISRVDILGIFSDIALRLMSQYFTSQVASSTV